MKEAAATVRTTDTKRPNASVYRRVFQTQLLLIVSTLFGCVLSSSREMSRVDSLGHVHEVQRCVERHDQALNRLISPFQLSSMYTEGTSKAGKLLRGITIAPAVPGNAESETGRLSFSDYFQSLPEQQRELTHSAFRDLAGELRKVGYDVGCSKQPTMLYIPLTPE